MEQADFLKLAVEVLERLNIPYMLVGSYASTAWGEARFTQDIDIVVDLKASQVPELCAAFPSSEFYVSEAGALDAIRHRKQFNVIHPESANKIDFMIARPDQWGRQQLERRREAMLEPALRVQIASPEDIIISKMRYYREGQSDKHIRDSAGVLARQGERIDRAYIEHWAKEFGLTDIWQAIVQRVDTAMAAASSSK